MRTRTYWQMIMAGTAVCVLLTAGVHAQEDGSPSNRNSSTIAQAAPDTTPTAAPADNAPAAPAAPGSAEDVMNSLESQIKKSPLIEPAPTPGSPAKTPTPTYQPMRPGVDPNIVGTAPNAQATKLRREGEFIISRKGRLVRSLDGLHTLLVFDADSKDVPEPPMAVVPCQMLQSMEDLLGQRGDQIKFIISGQILAYRGVNYILPTMMTLAEDRGNLQ